MENEELCALAQAGDRDAREELIRQNIRFIYRTAKTLLEQEHKLNRCLGLELDDLAQIGSMRVDRCIDRYDPEKEIKFLTYAAPAIRNAMIDYINKQNRDLARKQQSPSASKPAKPAKADKTRRRALPDLSALSTEEVEAILQLLPARDRQYLSYRWGLDQDRKGRSLKDTAEHFYLSLRRGKETEDEACEHLVALLQGNH